MMRIRFISSVIYFVAWIYPLRSSHSTCPAGAYVYPERINTDRHRGDLSTSIENGIDHETSASFLIHAFGKEHIIDIKKRNHGTNSFVSRTFSTSGSPITIKRAPKNCFYEGYIRGIEDSSVILSTCHGLMGYIQSNSTHFYIEPTKYSTAHKVYLADNVNNDEFDRKCGNKDFTDLDVNDFIQPHRVKRYVADVDEFYKPFLNRDVTRYNELAFVVDHDLYTHYGRDMDKVEERVFLLANIVDSIYVRINIRIVLVALEVWTNGDRFERQTTGGAELAKFTDYKNKFMLSKFHFDNAQFLSLRSWSDASGMAYVKRICTESSTGINGWDKNSIIGPWVSVAHEMGHNFGFHHDSGTCHCLTPRGCIMGGHKTRQPGFSNCSMVALQTTDDHCLFNIPQTSLTPECGNGIKDEGEECDCGTVEMCKEKDPCCNPFGCTLKSYSQCSNEDACCSECVYVKHGTVCRAAKSSCDLTDHCTGTSSTCPSDKFVDNGYPCSNKRQLFHGNKNNNGVEYSKLKEIISAQYVRIHPQYFQNAISMRLEFYGCKTREHNPFATTPIRSNNKYCLTPEFTSCDETRSNKLKMEYTMDCSPDYMQFRLNENGVLKHVCTGLNVCPAEEKSGSNIIISKDCTDEFSEWERTEETSLRHVATGKCMHPQNGYSKEGVYVVLWGGCSNSRLHFSFMKQDCSFSLGMEDGRIPDLQITSSSDRSEQVSANFARLNNESFWKAASQDKDQWIAVQFNEVYHVSGIAIQGRGSWDEWVTGFLVDYSTNGEDWINIADDEKDSNTFCYQGKCAITRDTQCQDIWGSRSVDGHQACYDKFNLAADGFGTCVAGQNASCTQEDVLCGQLQCNSESSVPVQDIAQFAGREVVDGQKCSIMITKNDDEVGKGMVLEGTKCGENKMCFGNKCKDVGTINTHYAEYQPVDGGWSAWSKWTTCTRACGGGGRRRHRFCDSPIVMYGGADCVGERVVEKFCNSAPCPMSRSCRHLQYTGKITGVVYPDGIYTIDPKGNQPIKTYCDMTRDGGGWTLLVTSHTNSWTKEKVLATNAHRPRLDGDYSILSFADSIKEPIFVTGKSFEYRLEAQHLGRWGGTWKAPRSYSFVSETNQQTNVKLTNKFDEWQYSNKGIEQRMPWISGARLTTSKSAFRYPWGSITGNDKRYHPSPWIDGPMQESQPEYIWYWMKEGEYKYEKMCQDLQLSQYHQTPLSDGYFFITPDGVSSVKTFCDLSTLGGGWTLIWTRKTMNGWNSSSVRHRPAEYPLDDDFSIVHLFQESLAGSRVQNFQFYISVNKTLSQPITAKVGEMINVITSELRSTKKGIISLFIREAIAERSCNSIKLAAEHRGVHNLDDGFYMIQSPKSTKDYLPVYCDMTSYPGAFTLLVTSANGNWTPEQVFSRNERVPSIHNDYSILHLADYIAAIGNKNTFMYKLDASKMGRWGGVWKAPKSYSFVSTSNKQTRVELIKKFDSWKYSWWKAIDKRMPWVSGSGNKALLTTSDSSSYWPYGSIIFGNDDFKPAPWLLDEPKEPGVIWYWVNEDDCDEDRLPVNGGFTDWTPWECDCKTKNGMRKRICSNPKPRCGGKHCSGVFEQRQNCKCTATPIRTYNNLCLAPKTGECNPPDGTLLTIQTQDKPECSGAPFQFTMDSRGVIRHECSGKVICTEGDETPTYAVKLVLNESCSSENSEFVRTPGKGLQNKNSPDYCVHPYGGSPLDGAVTVFWKGCNAVKNIIFDLFNLEKSSKNSVKTSV